ncbi:MAG: electron transport complex subunit RsxC [Pseudomonadales bacterium]|nr:electron transport complex subunit RsxC [Pseudomonadales bacterium]
MSPGHQSRRPGVPALHRFNGGIHPPVNKSAALSHAIERCVLAPRLILPLAHYRGEMAQAVVKAGDHVRRGQLLAKAGGKLSVNMHAPAAGQISAIREHSFPHASQLPVRSIILDTFNPQPLGPEPKAGGHQRINQEQILAKIEQAGIVGMGGAGFPTAAKLRRALANGVQTLIINAAECEPSISADEALLGEHAEEVCQGIAILQALLKPDVCLIGIEDSKPGAIAALEQACCNRNIKVVVIPTRYPSGGERQLIKILTGREVPSGRTPQDIQILCQNVSTCHAVYQAVVLDQPLLSRIVTVTGGALQRPRNLEVPLGTPISLLLAHCGLPADTHFQLVHGGPLMGFLLDDVDTPITAISNCIMAITAREHQAPAARRACIRCGFCAEACPAGLLPQQLYFAIDQQRHDSVASQGLFDCIECGACDYVCPSNIPLVQYYRAEKALIQDSHRADEQAAYWQQRFEFRQLRVKAGQQKQSQLKIQQEIRAAVARSKAKRAQREKSEPQQQARREK